MENTVGGSYMEEIDGGDVVGGNTRASQKLETPPPPFLSKIYELVEDSETNSFISWNPTGTTFIVWDHNKFSAEILPKHYKTTNFSSFVYQLNNYGFRKIRCDRHEYMNPWFQSGKKHWLNNIKRRNKKVQVPKKRGRHPTVVHQDSAYSTMESKLDAITNDQHIVREQIRKLKSSLNNMADQLANMQANTNFPEFEDEQMNAAAVLLKQLLTEQEDQDNGSNAKKIKVNGLQIDGIALEATDKVELSTKELISSCADDSGSSTQNNQMVNKATENAGNCAFWNELMNDNGDEGDLASQHSKAMVVLDEMMASDIAMQREDFTVKEDFDLKREDGFHLELWT